MKASRFSDAQKAFILKQGADGMPVADICRKAGISQATYFNWINRGDGFATVSIDLKSNIQVL
jgi:putative transposase